jgi:precorrin-6B methylase 1
LSLKFEPSHLCTSLTDKGRKENKLTLEHYRGERERVTKPTCECVWLPANKITTVTPSFKYN